MTLRSPSALVMLVKIINHMWCSIPRQTYSLVSSPRYGELLCEIANFLTLRIFGSPIRVIYLEFNTNFQPQKSRVPRVLHWLYFAVSTDIDLWLMNRQWIRSYNALCICITQSCSYDKMLQTIIKFWCKTKQINALYTPLDQAHFQVDEFHLLKLYFDVSLLLTTAKTHNYNHATNNIPMTLGINQSINMESIWFTDLHTKGHQTLHFVAVRVFYHPSWQNSFEKLIIGDCPNYLHITEINFHKFY